MNTITELNRTINMLMAHPDNEPNSEFADRIDSLIDLKEQLNIGGVSQQREQLKAYAELIQKDYTNHFFDDAVEESIDQFLSL